VSLETSEFERVYQIELDRIYQELGYEVVQRIQGKENRYYDLSLKLDGKEQKVEEKALQYYHQDCPIELIQNIWPFDLGWFYETRADYIHFLYYQDMQPHTLYQLKMSGLKELLCTFTNEDWKSRVTPRFSLINYGITLNLCIRWDYLIGKGCARLLKGWRPPTRPLR